MIKETSDGNDNPDNRMPLKYHYFVAKIYAAIITFVKPT